MALPLPGSISQPASSFLLFIVKNSGIDLHSHLMSKLVCVGPLHHIPTNFSAVKPHPPRQPEHEARAKKSVNSKYWGHFSLSVNFWTKLTKTRPSKIELIRQGSHSKPDMGLSACTNSPCLPWKKLYLYLKQQFLASWRSWATLRTWQKWWGPSPKNAPRHTQLCRQFWKPSP